MTDARSQTKPEGVATERYTYRVLWSEEDQEFVATCAEFPSLSHLADTQAEALNGIGRLIGDVVAETRAAGEDIPEPLPEQLGAHC